MDSQRIRVEIIRFALLLVVTVALISVAQRAFDSDKRATGATGRPGATPSGASTGGSGTTGTTPTTAPTASPGSAAAQSAGGGGSAAGGGSAGSSSGAGAGAGAGTGSTDAAGQPILPRTGPDGALRLAGVALVLITAGSLSVAGSRRTA